MSKHTPEPWEVERSVDYGLVAQAVNPSPNDSDIDGNREAHYNAARIVACVNACAGIDDPAAEIAALRKVAQEARRNRGGG